MPSATSAGRSTWSTSVSTVAERSAARAQDDRVQALQNLRGDVERHTGPRLEVGADRPDGDAQLPHVQPVRERPAGDLSLERLERSGRLELARERRHALLVEPKPVESSFVECRGSRLHVSPVRSEHLAHPFLEQPGRPLGAPVRPLRRRATAALLPRRRPHARRVCASCFTLYTSKKHHEGGTSPAPHQERSRDPARRRLGNLLNARCQPAEQPARIDVERRDEGEIQCPPSASAAAAAATRSASTESAPARNAGVRSSPSTTSTRSAHS